MIAPIPKELLNIVQTYNEISFYAVRCVYTNDLIRTHTFQNIHVSDILERVNKWYSENSIGYYELEYIDVWECCIKPTNCKFGEFGVKLGGDMFTQQFENTDTNINNLTITFNNPECIRYLYSWSYDGVKGELSKKYNRF